MSAWIYPVAPFAGRRPVRITCPRPRATDYTESSVERLVRSGAVQQVRRSEASCVVVIVRSIKCPPQ